jgi:adenosine deaminase/aminodeoxyfutalosine deaminase
VAKASPVEVRWIFDAVRQFAVSEGMRVAELAAERISEGVVAFGIGGDEARGPAEWFAEAFALARRSGLHLAPHAGETTGPRTIWTSLELGAERIGHGIRAIDDPVLVRHLRDHDIPIEVCLSSNVATGAVAGLGEHPIRRLFDAGVPITLNTDDPAMFRTTLTAEYELAARELGFSEQELRGIAASAFRYSFRKAGPETTSRT